MRHLGDASLLDDLSRFRPVGKEAPSLIQAGLKAIRGVGAGATFPEGPELSADQAALVPRPSHEGKQSFVSRRNYLSQWVTYRQQRASKLREAHHLVIERKLVLVRAGKSTLVDDNLFARE
jgi:hypothetical protein